MDPGHGLLQFKPQTCPKQCTAKQSTQGLRASVPPRKGELNKHTESPQPPLTRHARRPSAATVVTGDGLRGGSGRNRSEAVASEGPENKKLFGGKKIFETGSSLLSKLPAVSLRIFSASERGRLTSPAVAAGPSVPSKFCRSC